MNTHAQIEYFNKEKKINIHSDLCPKNCKFKNIDDEYKELLHLSLDEWFEKSNGSGYFYIGNKDPE